MKLGINIDHIATLRQARQIDYPDPIEAMKISEKAGCDSIVAHLREDRRHIVDSDVYRLKESITTMFNLEMSIAQEIVDIACDVLPDQVTLVPEKREELTTEGGLDVVKYKDELLSVIKRFNEKKIKVSLFIDPDQQMIRASSEVGCNIVELHTGEYANATEQSVIDRELKRIEDAVKLGIELGLEVNAGHGLNYDNVTAIAKIKDINELNIGHSIISYAALYGLENAVRKMKELIS